MLLSMDGYEIRSGLWYEAPDGTIYEVTDVDPCYVYLIEVTLVPVDAYGATQHIYGDACRMTWDEAENLMYHF